MIETDTASRPVPVVTATTDIEEPKYGGQPNYNGQGDLLQGACGNTEFTLVDAVSTIYYAGFQGCVKNRPECCPWAVNTAMAAAEGSGGSGDKEAVEFPQPVDGNLATLASCAKDYYSISGGCCPK